MWGVITKYTFTLQEKHSELSQERQELSFTCHVLNFNMLLFCLRGYLAHTMV